MNKNFDLYRKSSAVMSDCGQYRYRLQRDLGNGPVIVGIMVNPSTADGHTDDATIKRWIGFGERLGWGAIVIVNLFAYRSTDVTNLSLPYDPIGPENDHYIAKSLVEADHLICAWGSLGKLSTKRLRTRANDVRAQLRDRGLKAKCFGVTKDGQPKHPLMLSYETNLVDFAP